jgi:glycosyltransferase involved in cell wall biosynthesis
MQEWADDHSADRFQVHYEQQPNRGAPAARNLGAIRSSGSFLQFLDSDDKLHPCKIKSQVELLQKNPEVGFVYCLSSRFCRDQDHSSISGFDFERGGIAKMLRQNMCQTSAALYRRRVCRDAGPWDEDLRGGQDWEYSHRAILASDRKVLFQPEVYNFIRSNDSEERITKQGSQFVEQRFKALQKVHRLHAIRGALSRYIVQKSFALSYAQMAFLLHDFDVDRSSVQTALRLSLQTAPMFLKPVFLIPFYIYWLIPEGFSLAKRFVRMIR